MATVCCPRDQSLLGLKECSTCLVRYTILQGDFPSHLFRGENLVYTVSNGLHQLVNLAGRYVEGR